jgi:transcriptional regulator with XRE-family HTH domain
MTTTKTTTKAATISLEEMVDLKAKGLSLAQIGKMAGISKQGVSQRLKASGLDPGEIGQFKKDKSLILHGKQKMLLDSLTQEEIKKMGGRDKVVSFGIIYDKTRLQDDKSTVNLADRFTQVNISLTANPDLEMNRQEIDVTPSATSSDMPITDNTFLK